MRMRLSAKIWLALLFLIAVEAPGAQRHAALVLSRPVTHFSIGRTSALNALLWFGYDEHICFGIEFSGQELARSIRISVHKAAVSEVVKKILGSSDAYRLSVSDGVILIRKRGTMPPAWLFHRLPQFNAPRTELMNANNLLWMALETHLKPSTGGFAGDFPVTNPVEEVGPFHEQGRTVQQLLIRITGGSQGASWFPSNNRIFVSFPSSINRFWTLVAYQDANAAPPK